MKIKLNKKAIITIITTITIIGVIIIATQLITQVAYMKKYEGFSKKMVDLGLANLYQSGGSNDYKYVTNEEAAAIAVKAGLAIDNIEDYGYSITDEDPLKAYLDFGESRDAIPELMITESNRKSPVTRLDFLRILGNIKVNCLGSELKTTTKKLKINYAHKLQDYELNFLKDAVENDVFENKGSISKTTKIRRGEFNRAICEFINTNPLLDSTLGKIEENKDRLPSNAGDYPFVLSGLEKDVYEKPFVNSSLESFQSPNYLYPYLKATYTSTVDRVNKYLNMILNVDYNTISTDNILATIKDTALYMRCEREDVDRYVAYVKEHKIVTNAEIQTYVPAIYYDGYTYRIRAKVTLNVTEGDTLKDIIFAGPEGESVEYEKNKTFIVDYPLENDAGTGDLYPMVATFKDYII